MSPSVPPSPAVLDALIERAWNVLLPALPDELVPLAVAINGCEYARLNECAEALVMAMLLTEHLAERGAL